MSDTSHQQPSQEELQAYVEQLRAAEPADLLVQAYTMLATAAEVKIGTAGARVLIDAMSGISEVAAGAVEGDLGTRMRGGVAQLQTAQVQAERDGAAGAEQGAGETPDAPQTGAPQPPPEAPGQGQAGAPESAPGGQKAADRLWIPGRDRP